MAACPCRSSGADLDAAAAVSTTLLYDGNWPKLQVQLRELELAMVDVMGFLNKVGEVVFLMTAGAVLMYVYLCSKGRLDPPRLLPPEPEPEDTETHEVFLEEAPEEEPQEREEKQQREQSQPRQGEEQERDQEQPSRGQEQERPVPVPWAPPYIELNPWWDIVTPHLVDRGERNPWWNYETNDWLFPEPQRPPQEHGPPGNELQPGDQEQPQGREPPLHERQPNPGRQRPRGEPVMHPEPAPEAPVRDREAGRRAAALEALEMLSDEVRALVRQSTSDYYPDTVWEERYRVQKIIWNLQTAVG